MLRHTFLPRIFKFFFFFTDWLIIITTFVLSLLLKFRGIIDVVINQWLTLGFLLVLIPIILYLNDLYNHLFYVQQLRIFFRIVKVWLIALLVYVIVGFLTKFAFLIESRIFIILFYTLSFIFFFLIRVIFVKKLLECYFSSPARKISCKYVGPYNNFEMFNRFFKNNPVTGLALISPDGNRTTLDACNDVFLYSKTAKFDELYKEIKSNISNEHILYVVTELFNKLNLNWEWCRIGSMPVYTLHPERNQAFRDFLRRGIDILGSIFGLIFLSPFFALIGIAVKLSSPGPVIYKQIRCGKGGREFAFYKFRSMHEHEKSEAELAAEANYFCDYGVPKVETMNSKYITDIGKILRKTSIDEWPQFINVLKGEMSLIGPRPHRPHEVKFYKDWHKDRLSVKQGLTGLWQIYGRGEMPSDKSIFLDLIYVINHSISLDIKLIFQTIPAVILGKGAY